MKYAPSCVRLRRKRTGGSLPLAWFRVFALPLTAKHWQ